MAIYHGLVFKSPALSLVGLEIQNRARRTFTASPWCKDGEAGGCRTPLVAQGGEEALLLLVAC